MPILSDASALLPEPDTDSACLHDQSGATAAAGGDPTFAFQRSRKAGATTVAAARAIAHAAALGWWDALLRRYSVRPGSIQPAPAPVDEVIGADVLAQARAFGEGLADRPLEDAVARLGLLYTRRLPKPYRTSAGVAYTPVPLVRHLVDRASAAGMDWRRGKVVSPACGGGQFLVEDARRMIAAMGDAEPAIIIASIAARLRGWDTDPFACWLSQPSVEACLIPQVIATGKRLARITECRDSLLDEGSAHEGVYDLVNENPPFGKVKDSREIRRRYGRSLHGHPNLYGLFMDLSVRLAKPDGGIVALLTPTSYLGGRYFRALRSTLAELAPPVAIDLVASRRDVFPDVLQEVALSVFVRGGARTAAACSVVHVRPEGLTVEEAGDMTLPRSWTDPWLVARSPEDARLVASMRAKHSRLADWGYTVSTGPLVWDRAGKLGRLHADPGPGRIPVVWAEAVGQHGQFDPTYRHRASRAFYEPKPEGDANVVTGSCLLLQRTTAREQRRRLVGAVLPDSFLEAHGAVAVENHLNMVRPTSAAARVPLHSVAAFFASDVADRVMRCISGSVAVSATEIAAMPLPSAAELHEALASRDPQAALRRLYGIDDVRPAGAAA
jgi:adenine-specific DNA-methyltransferase